MQNYVKYVIRTKTIFKKIVKTLKVQLYFIIFMSINNGVTIYRFQLTNKTNYMEGKRT